MLFLTLEQHQNVLRRLLALARSRSDGIPFHKAGVEYTSLMVCLLLHNLSAAESLIRLSASFSNDWFPVTVGYAVARTMFETDVTGHYISKEPADRARQYINFAAILNKRQMDACFKHRSGKDPQWREAMGMVWQNDWSRRQTEVTRKFDTLARQFTRSKKGGGVAVFRNWSGKTLREMAVEVDHVEAYDIFYAQLSSFTHVDVHLADRFLQNRPDGPEWSQRAEEGDVGNVFRHADSFLACYLELFGRQFGTWSQADVQQCWHVRDGKG